MHWLLLGAAIIFEILATTMLKVSEGFSKPLAGISTVICYVISFYLLSLVLKYVPLSMAYAIWSAAGTIAIALIGVLFFSERLTTVQIAGILLTAAGVAMINLGAASTDAAPVAVTTQEHHQAN